MSEWRPGDEDERVDRAISVMDWLTRALFLAILVLAIAVGLHEGWISR